MFEIIVLLKCPHLFHLLYPGTVGVGTESANIMLHSRAIRIIVNTSFLVGNWPYKASLSSSMSNF